MALPRLPRAAFAAYLAAATATADVDFHETDEKSAACVRATTAAPVATARTADGGQAEVRFLDVAPAALGVAGGDGERPSAGLPHPHRPRTRDPQAHSPGPPQPLHRQGAPFEHEDRGQLRLQHLHQAAGRRPGTGDHPREGSGSWVGQTDASIRSCGSTKPLRPSSRLKVYPRPNTDSSNFRRSVAYKRATDAPNPAPSEPRSVHIGRHGLPRVTESSYLSRFSCCPLRYVPVCCALGGVRSGGVNPGRRLQCGVIQCRSCASFGRRTNRSKREVPSNKSSLEEASERRT
jgi:hypothetical protein